MSVASPAISGGSAVFQMLFANFLLDIGRENATPRPITCKVNSSVCYDIYGLKEEFVLSAPWSRTDLRPMTLVPFSPQQLNTSFWLFSSLNPTQPITLDLYNKSVLFEAPFHLQSKVYIVTHGYRSSGSSTWAKVDKLLRAVSLPRHFFSDELPAHRMTR
ncbi:hypothetical protein FHG87_006352 [Trinorchestia longiramus]|nr:hypothetical protein FHG87_006352 [Trinorchestia longiramus]